MTTACNLPWHIYGYVDRKFLSQNKHEGWDKAVWFGLTLPASRAVGLTVLLENGACFRHLPPHSFSFIPDVSTEWGVKQAQVWDCFGGDAQTIEYAYLRELPVLTLPLELMGEYLFTLEFYNDGFSRYPAQSKCFHAIRLVNGRLTFRPNDHLRWSESSFTDHTLPLNYLRRQNTTYGVEG